MLKHLTVREHDVLCLLFGINRTPLDSKLIGDMFGVGSERIRQIKENALKKLKENLEKNKKTNRMIYLVTKQTNLQDDSYEIISVEESLKF